MKVKLTTTLTLAALLLCRAAATQATAGAHGAARASSRDGQAAQAAQATQPAAYTATVKRDEARFTLTAPQRPEWRWRRSETRERAREYMMAVKVLNEGREYSFGFYLWKFPGSSSGRGDLSSLIAAGQKSLFERASNGHMLIIRDADVTVRNKDGRVVITVKGKKNVARLFSGRPAQVTFETELPDEPPTSQTVAVTYEG